MPSSARDREGPQEEAWACPTLTRIPVWQAGDRNWAPNHRKDDSQSTKVYTGRRHPQIGPTDCTSSHRGFNYLASILFCFLLRFNFLMLLVYISFLLHQLFILKNFKPADKLKE